MLKVSSVLVGILLASSAVSSPIVNIDQPLFSLPFAKKVNVSALRGIADHDRARAQHLASNAGVARRATSEPAAFGGSAYFAAVQIGSPATSYSLLIDTGSSNTWVGGNTAYKQTSTSQDTGASVSVSYGSGSFSGEEFVDRVSLGGGLTIDEQSIGVASTASGFDGVDGILGVGPADLTQGTLSTGDVVPTVTDNLFSSGAISQNLLAISFAPIVDASDNVNGELTFGGTDSSKFSGSITFAPITRTSPANAYWGIDQSVRYGSSSILASTAGIVDTGTTLILLATDAFKKYQKATGAVLDSTTGLLRVTASQFKKMQNLNFVIAGTTFALTPNAQIWPRELNSAIGGNANTIYLVVADLGTSSGQGLDFINGMSFLERFYSVYDTGNRRVGIANTPETNATTN